MYPITTNNGKNILLIEDTMIKQKIICTTLNDEYGFPNIIVTDNLEDAIKRMNSYEELIDLIVLDWRFPFKKHESAEAGAGELFLDYMLRNGYYTNVVICTADDIKDYTKQYPFVLGQVKFGDNNPGQAIAELELEFWKKMAHNKSDNENNIKLTLTSHK